MCADREWDRRGIRGTQVAASTDNPRVSSMLSGHVRRVSRRTARHVSYVLVCSEGYNVQISGKHTKRVSKSSLVSFPA